MGSQTSAAAQNKLRGQFRVSVGGNYTRAWPPGGVIHWGATTTVNYLLTYLVDWFPSEHTYGDCGVIDIVIYKHFSSPFLLINYS